MKEIKMPSAGQTTDEALVGKIYVQAGAKVKRGDVLCDMETDKAVLPVESFTEGMVLELLISEGDRVDAGQVLFRIGEPGEKTVPPAEEKTQSEAENEAEPSGEEAGDDYIPIVKGSGGSRVKPGPFPAMPNAKAMAKKEGLTLEGIVPANGLYIKRSDLQPGPGEKAAKPEDSGYTVLPMSRMRQIIAKRMLESKREIPAWQCSMDVDMGACVALRESFLAKKGLKLSYNDIIAKAAAVAAGEYELIRARYEEGELRRGKHINIGLAVGLEEALLVPVLKNVEEKELREISAGFKELVEKARSGRLSPGDMGCGSVTISNLGMYGVKSFTAIVNPPESMILALGGIRTEAVWNGQAFEARQIMTMTGSFDHRFIDGAYGAGFMLRLKTLLEEPALML